MFRRIELLGEMSADEHQMMLERLLQKSDDPANQIAKENPRFWKTGIMGYGNPAVWEAWTSMNAPRRAIPPNVRFYFTEEGWRQYGRKTIELCQQVGQRYRVLRIKENAVDVVYRDEVQVAVRPKTKKYSKARHGGG